MEEQREALHALEEPLLAEGGSSGLSSRHTQVDSPTAHQQVLQLQAAQQPVLYSGAQAAEEGGEAGVSPKLGFFSTLLDSLESSCTWGRNVAVSFSCQ